MWHRINNLRQKLRLWQSKVKIIFVLILLTALLLPLHVLASEGSVNMSVQVLPRKITDTINDFDFSSLTGNIAPKESSQSLQQVKGVSTQEKSQKISFWTKIINWFKTAF